MPRRKHSNGAIAAYPANATVAMAASTTSNCGFRRILENRADSVMGARERSGPRGSDARVKRPQRSVSAG